MNRRGFFSFLAGLPIAAPAIAVANVEPLPPAPRDAYPTGTIMNFVEEYCEPCHSHALQAAALPSHSHSWSLTSSCRAVPKIFDGSAWIPVAAQV